MFTNNRLHNDFARHVLDVVKSIPHGRISTYGDVAAMAGNPTAWRAVGNIMRLSGSDSVPCHRVVNSNGQVGGYSVPAVKVELLRLEGIRFRGKKILRFEELRWHKIIAGIRGQDE